MEVDAENARWAQDEDSGVVWCDSAEGLLAAVAEGSVDVEIGAAQPGPLLEAIAKVAPRLSSLSLTGCELDAPALTRLGTLLAPTQLRGVGVSNNPGIDLPAWAEFWEKLPPTVAKYDFGDDELPDEALPRLAAAASRGRVSELLLDGNCLANIGPLLPLVCPASGLAELDLGDNDLQDAHVLALAAVLPGSEVQTLVLGRNGITDAGVVPLTQVLPRTKIAVLHLDSTQIGDATLDALVGVLAGSLLEELHIDQTRVTDAGVLRLCRVLPSSRLTLLDASDNNLSDQTVAAIEAALPDTLVE